MAFGPSKKIDEQYIGNNRRQQKHLRPLGRQLARGRRAALQDFQDQKRRGRTSQVNVEVMLSKSL